MKKFKYFIIGFVLASFMSSSLAYALVTGSTTLDVFFLPIKYYIDGVEKKPSEDMKGFVYNGRTFVSLRFISEALGKEVNWDAATQSVYVGKNNIIKSTDRILFAPISFLGSPEKEDEKIPFDNVVFLLKEQLNFRDSTIVFSDGTSISVKGEDINKYYWKHTNKHIKLGNGSEEKDIDDILFIQVLDKKEPSPDNPTVWTIVMINNPQLNEYKDKNSISVQKIFQLVNMKKYPAYNFSAVDVYQTTIFNNDIDKAYIESISNEMLTAKFDNISKYVGRNETKGLSFISGITEADYFYQELLKK